MIPTMDMMLDLQERFSTLLRDFSRIESWEWPAEREGMLARAYALRDEYAAALEACE